ncbi:TPA: hypothetical protein ACGUPM_002673 [Vibrio vulnificus]
MLNLTDKKLEGSNDDDWLELVVSSRCTQAETISEISERLESRYEDYDDIIESPASDPDTSEFISFIDSLKRSYEKPPTKLKKKISYLRNEHGLIQCPFCGRPCKPRILDHFLPKDKWPEFSIFPNNLVQQCDTCSSRKWKHYYCNEEKSVKYIHPKYYDYLSLINISIAINVHDEENLKNATLKHEYRVIGTTSPEEKKRIILHIKELNISECIQKYIYSKYNDIINKVRERNADYLVLLRETIASTPPTFAPSNWEIALYEAMINNPIIVGYFENNKPTGDSSHRDRNDGEILGI